MSDELPDRIDVDLTGIDQPNAFVEAGTYQITIQNIENSKSKTNRPMLRVRWGVVNPLDGEEVAIFDYPLLDQQQGKFRLRQMIYARGLDERDWKIPQLVGATCQAEIEVEESAEFGTQNRIVRLLVSVPQAVRR